MREAELRQKCTCFKCNKRIGQCNLPIFHDITMVRHGIDMSAVRRQQGLAMQLNGHGALASVMGPGEDMTMVLCTTTLTICDDCMIEHFSELFYAYEISIREDSNNVRKTICAVLPRI